MSQYLDSMDIMNASLLRDRYASFLTAQQMKRDKYIPFDPKYQLSVPNDFGLNSLYKPNYEDKPPYETFAEEKADITDAKEVGVETLLKSYDLN